MVGTDKNNTVMGLGDLFRQFTASNFYVLLFAQGKGGLTEVNLVQNYCSANVVNGDLLWYINTKLFIALCCIFMYSHH